MVEKFNISSIPFSKLTSSGVLAKIGHAIDNDKQLLLTFLDANMIVNMKANSNSYEAICASDAIVADGYYVALALRFLGYRTMEQITGFDTALNVMKMAKERGYKIFFFGAEESVVCNLVDFATKTFGSSIIAGFRNGYFDTAEAQSIVEQINASGADILLVGISSPIRELFMHRFRKDLKVSFLMGVGGVFDILGGKTRRAPGLIIKFRLEWLYRFVLEPRRMWKRVFYACPYFAYCVSVEGVGRLVGNSRKKDQS